MVTVRYYFVAGHATNYTETKWYQQDFTSRREENCVVDVVKSTIRIRRQNGYLSVEARSWRLNGYLSVEATFWRLQHKDNTRSGFGQATSTSTTAVIVIHNTIIILYCLCIRCTKPS